MSTVACNIPEIENPRLKSTVEGPNKYLSIEDQTHYSKSSFAPFWKSSFEKNGHLTYYEMRDQINANTFYIRLLSTCKTWKLHQITM